VGNLNGSPRLVTISRCLGNSRFTMDGQITLALNMLRRCVCFGTDEGLNAFEEQVATFRARSNWFQYCEQLVKCEGLIENM
jgi:hypothetical protein